MKQSPQATSVGDFRRLMHYCVPRFVEDFIEGGADDEACMRRNVADLESITLVPRVLRDTRCVDTRIEMFGSTWTCPLAIAPTGMNGLIWPGGDKSLAAAAANMGIPFTLAMASNQGLEEIRQVSTEAQQWLQLYMLEDRGIVEQLIERASTAGFNVLVVTVDMPVGGLRVRDIRNELIFKDRVSLGGLLRAASRPKWALQQAIYGQLSFRNVGMSTESDDGRRLAAARRLASRDTDRSFVWDSLARLRDIWPGPILIKGLLSSDDARRSLDHGLGGLIVSNHGGRQFDAAPSAISVLPSIVDAVDGKIPVFFDGGVRSGYDLARALVLGASAAFVGRPVLYGLAVAGESGARDIIDIILKQLVRAMILLGVRDVAEFRSVDWDSRMFCPRSR